MVVRPHPLDGLSPQEIKNAASLVGAHFPGKAVEFGFITLKEPPKREMIALLAQESSGLLPVEAAYPTRQAHVQVIVTSDNPGANQLFELAVDLDRRAIVEQERFEGKYPHVDPEYMKAVEKACLADAQVQAEIQSLALPPEAIVCVEPWTYATDGMNDMSRRITMCWFYLRLVNNPDANYYAYPLDICAEVDQDLRVAKVLRLPLTEDERVEGQLRPFDRKVSQSASASNEYHPSLRPSPRQSTRSYQVIQPEGPSFQVNGNYITWEKWSLRVGFNYREGLTLHDIRFDGRNLFYRLSLAEMFVPYGDPRMPYPRKGAFDLGNDGAGINANNLRLGCDCLGAIKYFDAWHNTRSGDPLRLPNVICCHEQDDGILWKHTNFRTQNAVVTRSRVLVLQTIITVTNYEYIFAFHLGQDASIHYEVRATGIVSTAPIMLGKSSPYGTVVAPGVLAPYHQHLFSLRIDPAIDGHANSLVVEENQSMPMDKIKNPFGVGYVTTSRIIEHEQGLDLDFSTNRSFKMINERTLNPISGTPVGFKLVPCYSQMLLSHSQSFHARRSEFGQHAVWVTRYHDDEKFPAGRHTMQSMGGEGIASAIERRRNDSAANVSVRNEDIVVWHTFGSTHNPRVEDWPVMPTEKMVVGLKPVNFFTHNPGLDLAVSTQEKNQSVQVESGAGAVPCGLQWACP